MIFPSPLSIVTRIRRTYKEKIRRKQIEKRLNLDIKDRFYYPAHTINSISGRTYSVISAIYRVEKYLDEMLSSLLRQKLDFRKHMQVILVDDGSDDGSSAICKEWVMRFPNNIVYLRKENGGQASARNMGLRHATGDWIGFVDPDDILDQYYFLEVDRALDNENNDNKISLVSCHYMMYHEDRFHLTDNHALSLFHKYGVRRVVVDERCDVIQLSSSVALFNHSIIKENEIFFQNTRVTGEDAEFVARFLLACDKPEILIVPNALYNYRKRSTKNSSLDIAWLEPQKYSTQPQMFLDLCKHAAESKGYIPYWLQRTAAYDYSWHIKYFINNHQNTSKIPRQFQQFNSIYTQLLQQIFNIVDIAILENFELARVNDMHRFAMLALGHPEIEKVSHINIFAWHEKQGLFCCRYYYIGKQPQFKVKIGSQEVEPVADKIRNHRFLGQTLVREYIGWFPWPGNGMVSFWLDGEFVEQPVPRRSKAPTINRLRPKVHRPERFPIPVKVYRRLSQHPFYARRFRNAWLLMDRDTLADDNAEHLYRYIRNNHSEINAWFVLRRDSHDWARLKSEGFRLLAYGSLAHKMALLNAQHLASSHADHYVTNYLPRRYYNDLMRWNYTFLQHGVTQNDLSGWLNNKPIRHFITAAQREHYSICMSESGYKFTSYEVTLTGFPRHDHLLIQSNKNRQHKNILIMPTWRQSLEGETIKGSSQHVENPNFKHSHYYKEWRNFLEHRLLLQLAQRYGYQLQFFPHANLQPYLKDFETEHVTVLGHKDVDSIQDLFLSASLLVTDYSSVAFEMAYLERPILYYQFDEAFVFGGGHTTQRGYFNYRRDGFGPVSTDIMSILSSLEFMLASGCKPAEPYAQRMRDFFAFRDGRCCERVFHLIRDDAVASTGSHIMENYQVAY